MGPTRSGSLPRVHCASFAEVAMPPLQGTGAAQPARSGPKALRDRMAPDELARFVNDFLAGP